MVSSASLPWQHSTGRNTRTLLKQELFGQITWQDGRKEPYRRFSYGGEILQRFSDQVSTWGSFNAQWRLVHRRAFLPTLNDAEGEGRHAVVFEYHNLYFDRFNALDTFMSPPARQRHLGRFNLRMGRFYVPHGLNLQTDTHGTLLQLSNERHLGFERDWYVGFWGALSSALNYDLAMMAGSGYDLRLEGQKGLLALRLSLGNRFRYDQGWEGGISVLTGERLSKHSLERSSSVAARADGGRFIETRRLGLDARYTRPLRQGALTMTGEWSAGRDEADNILSQLYQVDFLRRDRRRGYALQYRRFRQDSDGVALPAGLAVPAMALSGPVESSWIGEVSWYLRNEVGNANLHWIKLHIERQGERLSGRPQGRATVQYYRYW